VALRLDTVADFVADLAASAAKEAAIEGALAGIAATWGAMALDMVEYKVGGGVVGEGWRGGSLFVR
jgi:dynein heavy chain